MLNLLDADRVHGALRVPNNGRASRTTGLKAALERPYALVLLDVMLPGWTDLRCCGE